MTKQHFVVVSHDGLNLHEHTDDWPSYARKKKRACGRHQHEERVEHPVLTQQLCDKLGVLVFVVQVVLICRDKLKHRSHLVNCIIHVQTVAELRKRLATTGLEHVYYRVLGDRQDKTRHVLVRRNSEFPCFRN